MDWTYLFKAAISFSILYGLFWLVLRKTTFHHVNRILLLSIIALSLALPLIKTIPTPLAAKQNINHLFEMGTYDGFSETMSLNQTKALNGGLSLFQVIQFIYWIGLSIFSLKFFTQLFRIIQFRIRNKTYKSGNYIFIYSKINVAPFSFFHWIILPNDLKDKPEIKTIIEHEKVHARQVHSLDNILTELFCIIFWFLPFVYLFKHSLKSIHEYLADKHIATNSQQKINYLKLLANETEKYTLIGLSSNFYYKTIQSRIIMMTKKQSSFISSARYVLLLPVLFFLVQSFAPIKQANKQSVEVNTTTPISFTHPIDANLFRISSEFGMRMHPIKKVKMMHSGTDFSAKIGTPVKASANGKIVRMEYIEGGYGNVVAIEHTDGFYTLYAQLSEFKTEIGANVQQGDIIALVGSSGMSTGPHLHFELRKNKERLNPMDYIK